MHRRRIRFALVATAVVASAAGAYFAVRPTNGPSAPTSSAPTRAATLADEPSPPPAIAQNAPTSPRAPTVRTTAAADPASVLRDALGWQDDAARIDAVEAAIASGATDTLPVLEHVVLREDPEAAPTVIHAVAVLGARASAAEHRDAAQTLSTWLRDESAREGADARGNTSVLVDALGDLGGADASQALAAALDRGTLPLHVETLAAQRLTALGDPSARDAIARFQARVAALPPTDGIDESLRKEALAVASNAEP